MLDTRSRRFVQPIIDIAARKLIKLKIKSNTITLMALFVGVSSAGLYFFGANKYVCVAILWFSGFLDTIDGTIARITNDSSQFGTIMDITFDRIVEISIILVLAYIYPKSMFIMLLLLASIIVSMTIFLAVGAVSAKKSEKSFYYQAGLIERTEGFIFLSLMLIFPQWLSFIATIFFLAILFTAGQRFIEAYKHLET
ncbi:MAG: CDP-alcohol phosphatidyltransferase family protein [Alkaliphilus sp.]